MKVKQWWKRITEEQLLIFGSVGAGLYLIYVSHLNIFLDTPLNNLEVRMTEALLGFCFLMIAMVIFVFKKRLKEVARYK